MILVTGVVPAPPWHAVTSRATQCAVTVAPLRRTITVVLLSREFLPPCLSMSCSLSPCNRTVTTSPPYLSMVSSSRPDLGTLAEASVLFHYKCMNEIALRDRGGLPSSSLIG
ncbi:hypothetical protein E2542_SST25259 [Spatholobus suberectus]|nr:hypothetical protein E2542_SST25259 [Spatholobus suberectus]